MSMQPRPAEDPRHRLVLWNIGLTLLDVARVNFTERMTVYIADSTRDVEAAGIGGARSIGVASGRSSAGELRDAGADRVLDDLADTAAVAVAIDQLTAPVAS